MGTHVWEFRLSIQVCVWVLTFSIHIQVDRFRYSDSGIQVWNSDLGIQDWVYRLADKYKAFTFSIHIQVVQYTIFLHALLLQQERKEQKKKGRGGRGGGGRRGGGG